MADLKITQLPQATTLATGDVFPVVNSGLTRQVSVQALNNSLPLTTFVRGASGNWGGGLVAAQYAFSGPYIPITDNLTNNTDNFPRWNTEVFNTDPGTYEFVNSGTTLARVFIKSQGYYLIISQPHYFDLYNNMSFTVKLFSSASSGGGMSYVTALSNRWFVGTTLPPGQIIEGSALFNVSSPSYYTVALFPTANTPYPSSSVNTPSRFTLIKVIT